MDVFEAINKRFSVRSYSDKPVEEEKLERVLEAARLSPSASNRQDWVFIVVKDPQMRRKLAEASGGQAFVGEAPVVLVCCGTDPETKMSCDVELYAVDVSIAMSYMMLQAVEEGLGTCWIGAFDQEQVKRLLGIPEGVKVVGLLPLGYPAITAIPPKRRKSLEEIVRYEKWQS